MTKQATQQKSPKGIRETFAENLLALLRDVIVPIRNVIANLVISVSFLLASEVIFRVIELTSSDLKSRIEFISLLLDGAQVVSFIATVGIFVVSTISDFLTQVGRIRESESKQ